MKTIYPPEPHPSFKNRVCKNTAKVWLLKGNYYESDNGIKVSKEDAWILENFRINFSRYPLFYDRSSRRQRKIYHAILGVDSEVDHINRNPKDNRRENLRVTDARGNVINRSFLRSKSSQYRGVSIMQGTWRAAITSNRKSIHLGIFKTEEEAALAYDQAAKKHHGEYAVLNFPNLQ
jgi:hypothetical protein